MGERLKNERGRRSEAEEIGAISSFWHNFAIATKLCIILYVETKPDLAEQIFCSRVIEVVVGVGDYRKSLI
jgi:hypothetical protein